MPQPRKHASHAARQAAYHQRREQAKREQLSAKGLPATPALPTIPGYPRWRQAIAQARTLLETVQTEMEGYAQQRSEQWQDSERAETFTQQIEDVSGACDCLNELEI